MWAIRNKKTMRWLYGTDYHHWPNRQRTSSSRAMIFCSKGQASFELKARGCGKDYEVVRVELIAKGE